MKQPERICGGTVFGFLYGGRVAGRDRCQIARVQIAPIQFVLAALRTPARKGRKRHGCIVQQNGTAKDERFGRVELDILASCNGRHFPESIEVRDVMNGHVGRSLAIFATSMLARARIAS